MRVTTVLPIGLLCLLTIACGPSSGEDVLIEVNDEVTLACTLLIPGGDAPLPVVVLIPGGGPHTRDVDVFGFQLFRETARHLHSHGIASLRCDKRGFGRSVGGSGPGEDTTLDFAADALAQVAYIEAGKTNYEIRILEDANHMFQKAVTGRVAEYSELPKEFIPGYLEAITAWVLDSVKGQSAA